MTRASAKLLMVAALLAPGLASAQAAAPAAAAAPLGPPIAGLCFFSRDSAVATSKAGQAATTRLRQLASQVDSELSPQRQALVTENNAIKALPAAQQGARAAALEQRAQSFGQTAQLRQAQLQLTQSRAFGQVLNALSPIVGPIASQRKCAVVFDGSATYGYNQAMDLTSAAVAQLDQRMPTITFDLATPAQVQAAQTQQQPR